METCDRGTRASEPAEGGWGWDPPAVPWALVCNFTQKHIAAVPVLALARPGAGITFSTRLLCNRWSFQCSGSEGGARRPQPLVPPLLAHGHGLLTGAAAWAVLGVVLAQLGVRQKCERTSVGKFPLGFSLCIIYSGVLGGKCRWCASAVRTSPPNELCLSKARSLGRSREIAGVPHERREGTPLGTSCCRTTGRAAPENSSAPRKNGLWAMLQPPVRYRTCFDFGDLSMWLFLLSGTPFTWCRLCPQHRFSAQVARM